MANGNSSLNSNDYWPNVLYDTREGNFRTTRPMRTITTWRSAGSMNYVALDVGNLKTVARRHDRRRAGRTR